MRGACGRWKWEVLGRRGHSEAKIALAVSAWQCTVHRTVKTVKYVCPNSKIRRLLQKDSPYCTHSTVPSNRLSTSLSVIEIRRAFNLHNSTHAGWSGFVSYILLE